MKCPIRKHDHELVLIADIDGMQIVQCPTNDHRWILSDDEMPCKDNKQTMPRGGWKQWNFMWCLDESGIATGHRTH